MDERSQRIGKNEALFRSVNERVSEINDAFATITEALSIVCECGYIDCLERIDVDSATYQRVRSDATLFIVVPSHVIPDTENVVESRGSYDIVRKHSGEAADLARALDPRKLEQR